eukprot:1159925-Pelagomonas_calceolata.AAC.6
MFARGADALGPAAKAAWGAGHLKSTWWEAGQPCGQRLQWSSEPWAPANGLLAGAVRGSAHLIAAQCGGKSLEDRELWHECMCLQQNLPRNPTNSLPLYRAAPAVGEMGVHGKAKKRDILQFHGSFSLKKTFQPPPPPHLLLQAVLLQWAERWVQGLVGENEGGGAWRVGGRAGTGSHPREEAWVCASVPGE